MSKNNSSIITEHPPRTNIRRGGILSVLAAAALAVGPNILVILFRTDHSSLAFLFFGALTPALPMLMLVAWLLDLSGFFLELSFFLVAILCWYGIGVLLIKFVHKRTNQILIWISIYAISTAIGMILFPLLFSD